MDNASKDFSGKIEMHLKEVFIIAKYWKEKGFIEIYGKNFLNWTIEFLYDDIHRLAKNEKNRIKKNMLMLPRMLEAKLARHR